MADDKADGKTEAATDGKGDADAKAFNLGIPDSAGHKGTISIDDNAPIESMVLAYQAVGKLADYIGSRVEAWNKSNKDNKDNKSKAPVLIHNPADFLALGELRAFNSLADAYRKIIADLLTQAEKLTEEDIFAGSMKRLDMFSLIAAAGTIGAIGGLIGSGLQVLSLFRADNAFKNYKIEVEDQVLAMTVAGRLASSMPVFSSGIVPVKPKADSQVLATLRELKDLRLRLQGALALLGGDSNTGDASQPSSDVSIQTGKSPKSVISKKKDSAKDTEISRLKAEIVQALKDFDAFVASLSKVDDKTGASRLSQLLIGENLDAVLKNGAYILWLKAVAAGGGSHAKTTTFTSELTYSGGAIASYAIFDHQGELKEADTVPMYGGKVSIEDLPFVKLGLFSAPPIPPGTHGIV